MSDVQEGPGWWLASDGKWYAPELAPGATQTQTQAPVRERRSPLSNVAVANYPQRVIASIIDVLVVWGPGLAIVRSVLDVNFLQWRIVGPSLLPFFLQFIYLMVTMGLFGGTVGNLIVGTKVVESTTGEKLDWAGVTVRSCAFLFLEFLLFFGFFCVAFAVAAMLFLPEVSGLLFFGLPALVPGVANAIWPTIDRRGQAWHDKAADCLVVKRG